MSCCRHVPFCRCSRLPVAGVAVATTVAEAAMGLEALHGTLWIV